MRTEPFDAAHADYLRSQRRGRLATVAPNGAPQNKPVGFRYHAELGTIDARAIERQVAELQACLRDQDAELYNRHFSADIMWGSPYGAAVGRCTCSCTATGTGGWPRGRTRS
jgi:Pyridoxamine 5'-phosphate oxidase